MINFVNSLDDWFSKEKKKSSRFKTLSDFIFGHEIIKYAFFRLRFFLLQFGFSYLIHLVTFYLIYRYFSLKAFSFIAIIWIATMALSSFWWGALEVLRTKIRYAYQANKGSEIEALIGTWLVRSMYIAVVLVLIASGLLFKAYLHYTNNLSIFIYVYSAMLLYMSAIRIVVLTYHSGIYAITRILRPAISLILGNAVACILLMLLWNSLSFYAIVLALVVSQIINSTISFIYVTRMYRFFSIRPKISKKILFGSKVKIMAGWDGVVAGIAALFIHLDSLLVILSFFLLYRDTFSINYFAAIILISPIFRAVYKWAYLFYFDSKRMHRINYKSFQLSFEKQLVIIAPVIGLVFWLLGSVVMMSFISFSLWKLCLLILPLFIFRSVISYRQIKAFSNFYYGDVIVSGLLLTLSYLSVLLLMSHLILNIMVLLLLLSLTHYYISKNRMKPYNTMQPYNSLMNPYEWLYNCSQLDENVMIFILKHQYRHTYHIYSFLNSLSLVSKSCNFGMCSIEPSTILLYACDVHVFSNSKLLNASLGRIVSIKKYHCNRTDKEHKKEILNKVMLKYLGSSKNDIDLTEDNLLEAFKKMFPKGYYLNPYVNYIDNYNEIHVKSIQKILQNSYYYLTRQYSKMIKFSYILSVLYIDNSISIVFLIPKKSYSKDKVSTWLNSLDALNAHSSVNSS